ncbi:MAG: hypothetical protein M3Z35_17880 [Nitrospirota bacterium]|nr:hypothetical protein [Nitrospirota bacterium]
MERLYREEGLSLRRRRQKKATAVPRSAVPTPTRPGVLCAMQWTLATDPLSKKVPVQEATLAVG